MMFYYGGNSAGISVEIMVEYLVILKGYCIC
jgi:hypothetical protein